VYSAINTGTDVLFWFYDGKTDCASILRRTIFLQSLYWQDVVWL